jgi:hypothetical protein
MATQRLSTEFYKVEYDFTYHSYKCYTLTKQMICTDIVDFDISLESHETGCTTAYNALVERVEQLRKTGVPVTTGVFWCNLEAPGEIYQVLWIGADKVPKFAAVKEPKKTPASVEDSVDCVKKNLNTIVSALMTMNDNGSYIEGKAWAHELSEEQWTEYTVDY